MKGHLNTETSLKKKKSDLERRKGWGRAKKTWVVLNTTEGRSRASTELTMLHIK